MNTNFINNTDLVYQKIINFIIGIITAILGLCFIGYCYYSYTNKTSTIRLDKPPNNSNPDEPLDKNVLLSCFVFGLISLLVSGFYFYLSINNSEFSDSIRKMQAITNKYSI